MNNNDELDCCTTLGCKMAHTLKAMIKELSNHFAEHDVDLTMEQYFLLNILDSEQGLILQDIADMIDRDKSAVVRHINALEKKHFVARATCDEDKRKKLLILTKPGLETLKQAQLLSEELEDEFTHQIDEKDLGTFEKVLGELFIRSQSNNSR